MRSQAYLPHRAKWFTWVPVWLLAYYLRSDWISKHMWLFVTPVCFSVWIWVHRFLKATTRHLIIRLVFLQASQGYHTYSTGWFGVVNRQLRLGCISAYKKTDTTSVLMGIIALHCRLFLRSVVHDLKTYRVLLQNCITIMSFCNIWSVSIYINPKIKSATYGKPRSKHNWMTYETYYDWAAGKGWKIQRTCS